MLSDPENIRIWQSGLETVKNDKDLWMGIDRILKELAVGPTEPIVLGSKVMDEYEAAKARGMH